MELYLHLPEGRWRGGSVVTVGGGNEQVSPVQQVQGEDDDVEEEPPQLIDDDLRSDNDFSAGEGPDGFNQRLH